VSSTAIRVGVEATPKKAFASALDWPGWSRAGKSPDAAVEALLAYAPRYVRIVQAAGLELVEAPAGVAVVQVADGDATTAFGAPSITFDADRAPTDPAEAGRLVAVLEAAWAAFDAVAAAAPAELRKGPRGGGRDTAKIVEHVLGAEGAYASAIGLRLRVPDPADLHAVAAFREALATALGHPSDGMPLRKWTQRYAARRITWHVLDHAWEIEDRTP